MKLLEMPKKLIEDTWKGYVFLGKKINIAELCSKEEIKANIALLKEDLDQLPDDVINYKSNKIFKSTKAKEQLDKYCFISTCKTKIVRLVDCGYKQY